MDSNIIIALLSLAGTAIGSLVGIMTSSKLTNHRIQELEKAVEKHNSHGKELAVIQRDCKTIWKNIDEIKGKLKDSRK